MKPLRLIHFSIKAIIVGIQSIKTDREYQLGVSFVDEYGRESPIFTSNSGGASFNVKNSANVNKIEAVLPTASLPTWAEYFKYYVKDGAAEYYNIALDRYYEAGDGGVWLSFPSSEVNKVKEGQYITLKKQHNTSVPVLENNKYKILSISKEAPDYIASVKTAIARSTLFAYDDTSFSKFTVGFIVFFNICNII